MIDVAVTDLHLGKPEALLLVVGAGGEVGVGVAVGVGVGVIETVVHSAEPLLLHPDDLYACTSTLYFVPAESPVSVTIVLLVVVQLPPFRRYRYAVGFPVGILQLSLIDDVVGAPHTGAGANGGGGLHTDTYHQPTPSLPVC